MPNLQIHIVIFCKIFMKIFKLLTATVIILSCVTVKAQELVIRIDDMGALHSVNVASIDTYQNGIAKSVEVLAVGSWFPEAVKMLKENHGLDVGIHLAITSEWENVKWRPLTSCPTLVDEDGYFYFAGRKKRLIIIAGYNVYPTDIERVVGEFPEINECCAVQGWDNGRSMVRLYLSLHDKNADKEALKAKISETLEAEFSKFYVPRDIIFMDSLPETPLMKVDFMKLSDKYDPNK